MIVRLHGKFAADYGKHHEIEAGSIAEAISALTRQLRFYDDRLIDDRPIATVVGYNTIESLSECPESIDILPAVTGGKGAGKILVGAALIGLSFVTGGVASPFVSGMLTNAIFGIGIGLAMAGLSQLFIKAPNLSQEGDPEASKYLGLSNNTTAYGTLRSYSMGRIKITAPHLLALNVDSNDLIEGEFPA